MKAITILLLMSIFPAHALHVFAVKENQESIEGEIAPENYIHSLVTIKKTLDDKVVSSLQDLPTESSVWKLQKFSLGIGLTGEIGIGPYKFGHALKQRFVYTR